jgi:hypothetical protein
MLQIGLIFLKQLQVDPFGQFLEGVSRHKCLHVDATEGALLGFDSFD